MCYFLHVDGLNKRSIGNISSLPISIHILKTYLDKSENKEKLPVGPTKSSPGPILLSVAATAVKLVVKLKLSILIIKSAIINIVT